MHLVLHEQTSGVVNKIASLNYPSRVVSPMQCKRTHIQRNLGCGTCTYDSDECRRLAL
jgi:hypothetical protein